MTVADEVDGDSAESEMWRDLYEEAADPYDDEAIHRLEVVYRRVGELHTYYRNPRQGDTKVIADSLRTNGMYRPIVVNKGTHTGRPDEVLAGNHTLMGARNLGWVAVATVEVDVDEDQAKRIVLADNRTSDVGSIDEAVALEMLHELDSLEGTGFDQGTVESMEASLDQAMLGGSDDDDQDILDKSDEASWPVLRVSLPPDIMERWKTVDGEDDLHRVMHLLDALGI